jgi:hypothetical protein
MRRSPQYAPDVENDRIGDDNDNDNNNNSNGNDDGGE